MKFMSKIEDTQDMITIRFYMLHKEDKQYYNEDTQYHYEDTHRYTFTHLFKLKRRE